MEIKRERFSLFIYIWLENRKSSEIDEMAKIDLNIFNSKKLQKTIYK